MEWMVWNTVKHPVKDPQTDSNSLTDYQKIRHPFTTGKQGKNQTGIVGIVCS